MEVITIPARSPNPLKRALPVEPCHVTPNKLTTPASPKISSPQAKIQLASASSSLSDGVSRQASPALSIQSSLTSMSATPPPPTHGLDGAAQSAETPSGQPPAKRRKLTDAEKEEKRLEKEQKAKEREEQKAKREEERQAKDEERRQKNEVKEEKKRERELEKLKKQEDEDKKVKKQPRINAFFPQPRTPAKPANTSGQSLNSPIHAPSKDKRDPDVHPKLQQSDYHRTFLPFVPPTKSTFAPIKPCTWDEAAARHMEVVVEACFSTDDSNNVHPQSLGEIFGALSLRRPVGGHRILVSETIQRIAQSEMKATDLTTQENPLTSLRQVPMHYLHFDEDVRPPYVGTYSKRLPRKLLRNPFAKLRNDTDYDYDSEAEWEEPEPDDEDLGSEGDSENGSIEADDEMEEFLDDADGDGQPVRRRLVQKSSDLEPISTGLCLEDSVGNSVDNSGNKTTLSRYKLDVLLDSIELPIDPLSTAYWVEDESHGDPLGGSASNVTHATFKPPVQSRPNATATSALNVLQATQAKGKSEKSMAAAPRLLAGQQLRDFKRFVDGSQHNKITILGLLKKEFPKVPKVVLSDTLSLVAARVGRSEAEKTWVLLDKESL